jgi:peroxiredoxin Q/BCP
MPNVGEMAPAFTAKTDTGETVSLADFRGQNVVLYFYPKDDTPGCTIEACEFRDALADIAAKDAVVLGVSPDDEKSHTKFKAKFNLNFRLLVDAGATIATAYNAYGEKKNYGRTYMGVIRKTYLIDKSGKLARVWDKVKPEGHAREVIEALASLSNE